MSEPPRRTLEFEEAERLEVVRVIDSVLLGTDDIDLDPSWLEDPPSGVPPHTPEEEATLWAKIKGMSVAERTKLAVRGNKEARTLLLRDANRMIQRGVLKNPRITEEEVLGIARNRQSDEELIREILANRDWMKVYTIRHALVENPKTPLHHALRMIPTLADRDMAKLGKSKNVPSAVATQARRLSFAKQR